MFSFYPCGIPYTLPFISTAIVQVCKEKGIKYDKSEEYYRVELKVDMDGVRSKILVNVAKNPNGESRCLAFILNDGQKDALDYMFRICKNYVKSKFEYSKVQ